MINAVVVAAVRPEWGNLLTAAEELKQAGVKLWVGCAFDPTGLSTDGLAGVRRLSMSLSRLRDGRRPRRFTPSWAWVVVRNRVVTTRARRAPLPVRTWLLARYDPWVREHAARADALVALEQRGVYAVWRLARKNDATVAVLGLEPLRAAAEDLRVVELMAEKGWLRFKSAAEVPAAWISALAMFGRSRREQLLLAAPRVVRTLRRLRAVSEAEALARTALSEELPPDTASWLRLELTAAQLTAAVEPEHGLAKVVSDVLSASDAHLRVGRIDAAAELAISVAETVFNRELHAEVDRSPLAENPESFLAPLRLSLTYQALAAPAGSLHREVAETDEAAIAATFPAPRTTSLRRADTDDGMLHRLMVISEGNLHFAEAIIQDLEAHAAIDYRRLMLREQGPRFGRRDTMSMMVDRIGEAVGRRVPDLETPDADLLSWPDTVFVDWCDNAAMWTLLHVPREVRLVIRLHSIEAFSHQPHMMDWSRVADLVFVGAHVRDFMLRAVPTMASARRVHVLPNAMRLTRFGLPKRAAASRTVAMVGWGQQVKDPVWAVEVLARLRVVDEQWRLMLIGRDFADSQTTSGALYRAQFRERIRRDDVRDGVVFVPFTDDLPDVLRDAGFVINASLRESFGVGLCEGAASAAVPVVRNWPVYAAYGGARAVFPADWVVADVDEAVQRVLEHSVDAVRRTTGAAARRHVVETFDWPVVAPTYRETLLGTSSQRNAEGSSRPMTEPGVATARD
ncbi:MAG TPA: glycosyltransferase family 4 protein [Jiangellaceae bacterium]|nr:glycosyltransferase family 4 protein [Jiangellaceae bacterium]